jgi:hypothetical protein
MESNEESAVLLLRSPRRRYSLLRVIRRHCCHQLLQDAPEKENLLDFKIETSCLLRSMIEKALSQHDGIVY